VAHIEKRGRRRWRARYRGPDGRERSKTFERRADAEQYLASIEHSKSTGVYVDPSGGRVTVREWATQWLETVRPTLKPKTVASYESLLRSRVLPALATRQLASLRPSDVQEWIGQMWADGLSASRTRQAVVLLRQLLDAAVRDGIVGRNATGGVKLPKIEQHEAPYFEPDVVERVASFMPEPYELLTRILGTLGPRWGEGVALRCRHVDLLRRRLRIEESLAEVSGRFVFGATKSHAVRSVPLPPDLAAALASHVASISSDANALLFTGPKGGPLRYRYFYMRLWQPALKSVGLPVVGVHALRHSAAARMIQAGASPKALQSIMGHRSAAFTLTVYGHMFDADLDELASRLDFPAASPRPGDLYTLKPERKKGL
jgi:integrase